MFTGIIEAIGKISAITPTQGDVRLKIESEQLDFSDVKLGDSIASNGICLTVVELGNHWYAVDVSRETLNKTALQGWQVGDLVNLEKAMLPTTRFGGHIVSGHIDGTAKIIEMKKDDNATRVTLTANDRILKYIISEGSVALDGVSLTVAHLSEDNFTVSLIPHTSEVTTLLSKSVGSIINVENDVVGKYVERLLSFKQDKPKSSSLSLDFLRENGF